MPSAILMHLRHYQELDLGAVLFLHVTNPLRKGAVKLLEVIAVHFQLVQCSGKEILPVIAKGDLEDRRARTGKAGIQLAVMVLVPAVIDQARQAAAGAVETDNLINLGL